MNHWRPNFAGWQVRGSQLNSLANGGETHARNGSAEKQSGENKDGSLRDLCLCSLNREIMANQASEGASDAS